MKALLFASLVAMTTPAAAATLPTDNPQVTALDRSVQTAAETFFADSCHAGLSIAVYDQGKTHFYNYGTTSRARPALPRKDSLYEIGSITKTFTGALAAKAILDGRMTLDGDFRAHLAAPYPNLERNGKPVTLRTLAAHTSGLQRDIPSNDDLFQAPDFNTLPYKLLEREKDYDRPRYLKELHDAVLLSDPGQTLRYSNIGIKLIGFGLENIYGKTYPALLEEQIFTPLGMTDTGLTVPAAQGRRLVDGHGVSGQPAPHILPNAGAAAGILSTSQDLIKFAIWHLDERDPVVRTAHGVIHGDAATYGEAMILQVTTANGERKLWQSGGVFGMSSQMILFPDSRRAYVLLANDGCFDSQSQLETLALSVHAASGARQ